MKNIYYYIFNIYNIGGKKTLSYVYTASQTW